MTKDFNRIFISRPDEKAALKSDLAKIKDELIRLASVRQPSVYHVNRVVTLAQQKDYLEEWLAKLEAEIKK